MLPDRKVPGDIVYAQDINAMNDALKDIDSRVSGLRATLGRGGVLREPATTIRVYNNTGGAVNVGEIYGIKGQAFVANELDIEINRVLEIEAPVDPDHLGKWVILVERISNGAIGDAYIGGTCLCKINVNDVEHFAADVKDGDKTQLESRFLGHARILWKEAGLGTKYAVIRFPDEQVIDLAKLQEDIDAHGTGNVKRCYYDGIGGYTEIGNAFIALNIGPGDAKDDDIVALMGGGRSAPFFNFRSSVISASIVAVTDYCHANSAAPSTNFKGTASFSLDHAANERIAFFHFDNPITLDAPAENLKILCNYIGSVSNIRSILVSAAGTGTLTWLVELKMVLEDFDTATLTWNNKPTTLSAAINNFAGGLQASANAVANGGELLNAILGNYNSSITAYGIMVKVSQVAKVNISGYNIYQDLGGGMSHIIYNP